MCSLLPPLRQYCTPHLSLADPLPPVLPPAPVHADLGTGDIATRLADESLAALWGTSGAAAEEFPASPEVVRKAVALGRQMLDPLALLAALCGE